MHATLLAWLHAFEEECSKEQPTSIYNSLVQLGLTKLGADGISPISGNPCGCDCLEVVKAARETIQRIEKDLTGWMRDSPPDVHEREQAYMSLLRENIELYTSLHNSHAEYNRRVWEILRDSGKLAKVRSCLLRDLRGGTMKSYDDPDGKVEYCRMVLKPYGEMLRSFVTSKPEGWF